MPSANLVLTLFAITILFLLSRISVLIRYGISITYFLLFGIVLIFGPVLGIFTIATTSVIFWFLVVKETPIDFVILKDVQSVFIQTMYLLGGILLFVIARKIYGFDGIMQNLIFVYMLFYLIFALITYALVLLFTEATLTTTIPAAALSIAFNLFLAQNFALKYLNFLTAIK